MPLRAARLHALAYSPHLAEYLASESVADMNVWRERSERAAAGETMATLVAAESDDFVGIVDGFISDDGLQVEIGGMWVSPIVRRSGVGRRLVSAICAWGRARGAERAGLWVRWENTPARLLYEREGFEVTQPTKLGAHLERAL